MIPPLPETENAAVIRTDFTDDVAWQEVCDRVVEPTAEGFQAYVHFLSNPAYRDCPAEQVVAAAEGTNRSYLMIVDRETISHPEHPLLIVDLFEQPTRSFRAVPPAIQAVENNLSLANMDFEEFADAVDGDGIFRDFFTH